jgi:hypothetical protein
MPTSDAIEPPFNSPAKRLTPMVVLVTDDTLHALIAGQLLAAALRDEP